MALDGDYLLDRRRLKSRLTWWRLAAILAIIAAGIALLGDLRGGLPGRDHVAILEVFGIIQNDPDRLALIEEARDDPDIRALIVHIDSPGGTVVGGETLYRALRRFSEEKPVVAVMGDLATSAGYMTAIAADRIFAQNGTVTGSIGVLFQNAEITSLLERLGITVEAVKSGPLKAAPNPLEKTSPEARAATEALVRDMFTMFTAMVSERRNMTAERVAVLADGRVYTGRMALENGLIDEIGGEREALLWLETEKSIPEDLPVRILSPKKDVESWFEKLTGLAGKTMLPERLTLDGLVSVWHPSLR